MEAGISGHFDSATRSRKSGAARVFRGQPGRDDLRDVFLRSGALRAFPLTDPGCSLTHPRTIVDVDSNNGFSSLMSQPPSAFLVTRRDDGFGDVYPLQHGARYKLGRAPTNKMLLK